MQKDSKIPVRSLCQGCGEIGTTYLGETRISKPSWCKCTKRSHGPIVAAPGTVVRITFESADDAAFRARCDVASKAFADARDAWSTRWVRCGRKGWRELPATSPKVRALDAAYRKAERDLEKLQAECRHPQRSLFSHIHCDVCHAHVECDVAHYRHLVREVGVRYARRVAV